MNDSITRHIASRALRLLVSQNALLPGAEVSSSPIFYVWPRPDRVDLGR